MKPNYQAGSFLFREDEHHVVILDLYDDENPTPTVTNAVESVLEDLKWIITKSDFLNSIVYRDSEGDWDEIVVDEEGKFIRFAPLRDNELRDALVERFDDDLF